MKTLFKIFTTFAILAVVLLSPWLGFAVRGAFPFDKPEFKGLTYYQLLEWRWWDLQRQAREFRLRSPNKPVRFWGEERPINYGYSICFWTETTIKFFYTPVHTFEYTLAGLNGVPPSPGYSIPTGVTYANFPAKMWETYETLLWYNLDTRGMGNECASGNNIPSVEEFDETVAALKSRVAELDEKIAPYISASSVQSP